MEKVWEMKKRDIYIVIILGIVLLLFIIRKVMNSIKEKVKQNFGSIIASVSEKYKVDSNLVTSIICVESSGNPNVKVGAAQDTGLMQITPIALKDVNSVYNLGYTMQDMFVPEKNIEVGTALLSILFKRDDGKNTLSDVIRGYNMGLRQAEKYPAANMVYYNRVVAFMNFA